MAKLNAHDVASYVLQARGGMSPNKLHKLLYYTQAWSLVWNDAALFDDKIEAWAGGPILPDLWELHDDGSWLKEWPHGSACNVSGENLRLINGVLDHYIEFSTQDLSDITHAEDPWNIARGSLFITEQRGGEITLASLRDYYSSLVA